MALDALGELVADVLAISADAVAKAVVGEGVKDAYKLLKQKLGISESSVPSDNLVARVNSLSPEFKLEVSVLTVNLADALKSDVNANRAIGIKIKGLHASESILIENIVAEGNATGADIKDISATSVRLSDIIARNTAGN